MQKLSLLQKQAVQAAKNLSWQEAIGVNQEILEIEPNNIAALNRLGVAQMQLGETKQAEKTFQQVMSIDKSNIIAQKHLNNIKKNQPTNIAGFSSDNYFIEEPGKTKIVELQRLNGKSVLSKLKIGETCLVNPKNRYISIELSGGERIGTLPDDLSFRLSKLIERGNEYSCIINSCSEKTCLVQIRETKKSKKNEHVQSFPCKNLGPNSSFPENEFALEDDIPFQFASSELGDEPDIEDALEKIDSND
ncbi:MAG: tetratricopeptide repeat protein [Patescibacteria group bacterium]